MGIIRRGIYDKATLSLKEVSQINHFVETGTYYGSTTEWASNHFGKVSTIELSKALFQQTSDRLSNKKNIDFYLGDSRVVLKKILSNCSENCIFWLDAHWSGGETAGEEAQCPLLNELETIFSFSYDNIVMIDDARTYLLPPKKPNDAKQFPTIVDIINTFDTKKVYLAVLEDVIYLIPIKYKEKLVDFFQEEARRSESDYYESLRKLELLQELLTKSKTPTITVKFKRTIKKIILNVTRISTHL